MRLFAPKYYKDFKCISSKCTHSCCIGWEIRVDADSVERYRAFSESGDFSVYESLDFDGDGAHFALCDGGRCPHLCDTGLCNIILNHGEAALSDICREHPRFYNISKRRCEVGLGAVCEEAARLILECDDYTSLYSVGEYSAEECDSESGEIDAYAEREKIYAILSDSSIPYSERLLSLWDKYSSSPSGFEDEYWHEFLSSLEYMGEGVEDLFSDYSSLVEPSAPYEKECERFLAYLIYRYLFGSMTEGEIKGALGFAFFAERLFFSLIKNAEKSDTDALIVAARTVSEEIEYSEGNRDEIMSEFLFM